MFFHALTKVFPHFTRRREGLHYILRFEIIREKIPPVFVFLCGRRSVWEWEKGERSKSKQKFNFFLSLFSFFSCAVFSLNIFVESRHEGSINLILDCVVNGRDNHVLVEWKIWISRSDVDDSAITRAEVWLETWERRYASSLISSIQRHDFNLLWKYLHLNRYSCSQRHAFVQATSTSSYPCSA